MPLASVRLTEAGFLPAPEAAARLLEEAAEAARRAPAEQAAASRSPDATVLRPAAGPGDLQAGRAHAPSPGSRSSFRIAEANPPDAEKWGEEAALQPGSWWPDYVEWLTSRSGGLKPAPKTLGCRGYKATAKAPGSYVHAA